MFSCWVCWYKSLFFAVIVHNVQPWDKQLRNVMQATSAVIDTTITKTEKQHNPSIYAGYLLSAANASTTVFCQCTPRSLSAGSCGKLSAMLPWNSHSWNSREDLLVWNASCNVSYPSCLSGVGLLSASLGLLADIVSSVKHNITGWAAAQLWNMKLLLPPGKSLTGQSRLFSLWSKTNNKTVMSQLN